MYHILICDDEQDIVNALKIYLSSPDFKLFEANTGVQALEVMEREDIHLILLDMNNVCKYAQRGTRVYLTLEEKNGQAIISFKNISREPLNLSPDELMERFVQGDTSRKSEGSGLGLSIAKSLTELQNGTMELATDGDLFKVVLRFPTIS